MHSIGQPKVLVFDFFGVICSEVAPIWLACYLPPDEAIAVKASLIHSADIGQITQKEMFSRLSDLTRITPEQIEAEWQACARIDTSVVELLDTLKLNYRLALLTNSPPQFVRGLLDKNNLEHFFEAIVVSGENGCAKPDSAIYQLMLSALAVPAQDTLMIDDNQANVTGAINVGMGGLLFESNAQLEPLLSSYTKH